MGTNQSKKRLLSGIQPSGELHVGNYFGAMQQFLAFQKEYESYIMIADLHALTTVQDPDKLSEYIFNTIVGYLAVGLDPEKIVLFRQSHVPEHTELAWIFSCITTTPYLERAHAYKDKVAKGIIPSAGLFTYPTLMASDILMYDPDIVPVGKDQKQHVEITRDIAEKFNSTYGESFKLPQPHIPEEVAVIPGTDGQKMSKSYDNTIPLFATDTEIEKAVMSIPTDSRAPDEPKEPTDILFQLHALFSGHELDSIREGYEKGGLSYSESKKKLIANIVNFIAPLRERREEIMKDRDSVLMILQNGSEKARSIAKLKMHDIRQKVGLQLI